MRPDDFTFDPRCMERDDDRACMGPRIGRAPAILANPEATVQRLAAVVAARAGHLHETLQLLLKADLENEIARHMASILEPMANDVRTLAMYLNLRLSSDEFYRDKES